MAGLSVYLTWTALVFAVVTLGVHIVHATGSLRLRAVTGETEFGTVSVVDARERRGEGTARLAAILAALVAATLGSGFAARWQAVGHAPVANLYEFTTAFAFGISAAHLGFLAWSRQVRFGLVSFPVVVVMLAIATTFPSEARPLVPALQNGPLLALHVSVMMASYAILTVALCGAVVYLAQGGDGRGRIGWLPPAEAAEDLAHRAVVIGFPLLGLGIALGAYWANSAWGRYWGWDPKETSALVTWLALAAYFHARAGTGTVARAPGIRHLVPDAVRRGWRPDPMWWLVFTWGLIMFTYFGVNLWITGLHSYAGV